MVFIRLDYKYFKKSYPSNFQKPDQIFIGPTGSKPNKAKLEPDPSPARARNYSARSSSTGFKHVDSVHYTHFDYVIKIESSLTLIYGNLLLFKKIRQKK